MADTDPFLPAAGIFFFSSRLLRVFFPKRDPPREEGRGGSGDSAFSPRPHWFLLSRGRGEEGRARGGAGAWRGLRQPAGRAAGAAWVGSGRVWDAGEAALREDGGVSAPSGAGAVPAHAARPAGTPFPGSPRARPACAGAERGARWELESFPTWCGRRPAAEGGNAGGERCWGHVG